MINGAGGFVNRPAHCYCEPLLLRYYSGLIMGRCIAIGNHKGGVGKTTIAHAAGAEMARRGLHVLLVDLDAQAALTAAAGLAVNLPGMAEVIAGAAQLAEVVRRVDHGLDIAPAAAQLAEVEVDLARRPGRESVIRRAVAGLAYDVVLFDCPPSLGLITAAALIAAGAVIIPTGARVADLRAARQFIGTVDRARAVNPGLAVIGVVPTFVDARRRHDAEALAALRAGGLPVWAAVPASVRIAEAAAAGVDPISYAGRGNPAAAALVLVAEEVLKWLKNE